MIQRTHLGTSCSEQDDTVSNLASLIYLTFFVSFQHQGCMLGRTGNENAVELSSSPSIVWVEERVTFHHTLFACDVSSVYLLNLRDHGESHLYIISSSTIFKSNWNGRWELFLCKGGWDSAKSCPREFCILLFPDCDGLDSRLYLRRWTSEVFYSLNWNHSQSVASFLEVSTLFYRFNNGQ